MATGNKSSNGKDTKQEKVDEFIKDLEKFTASK